MVAFRCSTYAELFGDKAEQERLFRLGYASGKKLLDGLIAGTYTNEDVEHAPVSFTMLLGGPSADFMLGRIFEVSMSGAFDEVTKENFDGTPIYDPSEWIIDDEIKAMRATNLYHESNCELLR